MKSKKIKEIALTGVKGVAIGISMIIPGLSGGTLAVLMNIYDKILEAITGIFKHFKESLLLLLPLVIGAVIGFIGLVFPINYGLAHFPLIIVSLFVGFIIGGLPSIYKKVQGKENWISILIGLIALGITISLCFIKTNDSIDIRNLNVGTWFYLFLSGIIASIALVAPGISGSMTLMVLGVYVHLMEVLKEILSFTNLWNNSMILLPLALGLIIGFIFMSFFMKYMLKNHETSTYFALIGFIIGSIVSIYYLTITDEQYPVKFDALNIILSIVVLILGVVSTLLLERFANKHSKDKIIEVKE